MSEANDMRRDFEAFVTERHGFDVSYFAREADSDTYLFFTLENEWEIWQAATKRATALERERCAVVAETQTKRQRTIQGMINSEPAKSCNLAASIRQGGAG